MICTWKILTFAIAVGCSTGALAAPQDPVDLQQDTRALDEGVEDVGPLSASLRVTEIGLAPGSRFDRVLEVPGRPDLLMRVSGGLYALFPRSQYAGGTALIPNDTSFYIGVPDFMLDPGFAERAQRSLPGATNEATEQTSGYVTQPAYRTSEGGAAGGTGGAMIVNEGYRSRRIHALLAAAAERESRSVRD